MPSPEEQRHIELLAALAQLHADLLLVHADLTRLPGGRTEP